MISEWVRDWANASPDPAPDILERVHYLIDHVGDADIQIDPSVTAKPSADSPRSWRRNKSAA